MSAKVFLSLFDQFAGTPACRNSTWASLKLYVTGQNSLYTHLLINKMLLFIYTLINIMLLFTTVRVLTSADSFELNDEEQIKVESLHRATAQLCNDLGLPSHPPHVQH